MGNKKKFCFVCEKELHRDNTTGYCRQHLRGENHHCYGVKQSLETKNKRNSALRGQKRSLKTRERHSAARKELWQDPEYRKKQSKRMKCAWADKDFLLKNSGENHGNYGSKRSDSTRKLMSDLGKARWEDSEYRDARTGKNHALYGKRGKLSKRWKGGAGLRIGIRQTCEYFAWRNAVFARDNYTCQDCGSKSGKIHAHHIKPFIDILNNNHIKTVEAAINCVEFWDVSNGITLCHEGNCCHYKRHNFKLKKQEG